MTRSDNSRRAFERASRVLVGGVNSPVRAFRAVGGVPRFIASGAGAKLTDVDGNELIDYVGGYGPMILGHAHPEVVEALDKAARRGTCYGGPTEAESELAERVIAAFPGMEQVRFVSSGTEAVMSAVRLARGATDRHKIIKCIGGYHGHSDMLLVQAGSGALTLGVPSSPGVPPGATADTLTLPYNDPAATAEAFERYPGQIAAVLIEPVAGNMGVVLPKPDYLPQLRQLCDRHGALLILDEVMTCFRLTYGGAQHLLGVRADLTTFGKIIGGGLPVGGFGGPLAVMKHLAPVGPVYQAGTLSGNPMAMAAGLATLDILRRGGQDLYGKLEQRSAQLARGLTAAAEAAGLAGRVTLNRIGSMMTGFFAAPPVVDYISATRANTAAYAAFFNSMLDQGVYLAPSQFEATFVSIAHTEADIDKTISAARAAFAAAAKVMDAAAGGR